MEKIDNEYYVSLEVAKLLKEAGFDWKCKCVYNKGKLCTWYEPKSNDWWKCQSDTYAAPTLDVAQRWLREVKHFQIEPKYYPSSLNSYKYGWMWHMFIFNPPYVYKYVDGDGFFDTYEEAQEAGIKKALEMILEKGE